MLDRRAALLRLLWLTLPFTLGPLLAEALDPRTTSLRITATVCLWAVWGAVLVATLVPLPATLTALRTVAPATVPAAVWSTVVTEVDLTAAVGLAAAVAATLSALAAPVGDAFVDGASYGDERRLPLRPPGAVLAGPLPLAWALTVAGAASGPLLLGARWWVPGALATVAGIPVALAGIRALHQLSRRWLVFVPAGFVVHDHLAVAEPVLFRRNVVTHFGLAPADTTATDLTAGALGPALQADLRQEVTLAVRTGRRQAEEVAATSILVMPTRPGKVLAEARARRIAVG